jgi:septal ring factor EnvC (AmiA/AmiB activator)
MYDQKNFGRPGPRDSLRKEQFLNDVTNELGTLEELQNVEGDLQQRRQETLFKVTTEMEDTTAALKKAEETVARLKKHLSLLEGMRRLLQK